MAHAFNQSSRLAKDRSGRWITLASRPRPRSEFVLVPASSHGLLALIPFDWHSTGSFDSIHAAPIHPNSHGIPTYFHNRQVSLDAAALLWRGGGWPLALTQFSSAIEHGRSKQSGQAASTQSSCVYMPDCSISIRRGHDPLHLTHSPQNQPNHTQSTARRRFRRRQQHPLVREP